MRRKLYTAKNEILTLPTRMCFKSKINYRVAIMINSQFVNNIHCTLLQRGFETG